MREPYEESEPPWSAEDDELVRRALRSLRADVEDAGVAPLGEVKQEGQRRRRHRFVAGAAVAAAAAVVAGTLAATLPRGTGDDPAGRPTTSISQGQSGPIAGPAGMTPPARLFLAPSDFDAPLFTREGALGVSTQPFAGSPSVGLACDADTVVSGTVGLLRLVRAGSETPVATQRLRAVAGQDGQAAEISRLEDALGACTARSAETTTRSYDGPARGTYKLETTGPDGQAVGAQFVAIGATGTPGYVSTLVLTAPPGQPVSDDDYFSELDRLARLVAAR